MIDALDIRVRGIVQGVGFRPFVYRLARRYLVNGWVLNDADGVFIHAEGESALIDEFVNELHMNPPAASKISEVELKEVPLQDCTTFEIRESQEGDDDESTLVSADLCTCDDCLEELFDPTDRRFRYPFVNCTNCGPRFTIIDELPYDRPKTSMVAFKMCADCAREYADPADRRFHAQPDACFECGPHLTWADLRAGAQSAGVSAEIGMHPGADGVADAGNNAGTGNRAGAGGVAGVGNNAGAGAGAGAVAGANTGAGAGAVAGNSTSTSQRSGGTPAPEVQVAHGRAQSDEFLARAIDVLKSGSVVAVKGLGGFHLVCDAADEKALATLRTRKRRDGKAFAVMVANADDARRVCHVSSTEEGVLKSPARPIVLLKKRADANLAAGLADALPELGVMLPATPVQHLLIHDYAEATGRSMLVMTSGNVHDEPIVTDDADACVKLAGIADALLGNDRPILSRYDDSVVRVLRLGGTNDYGEPNEALQFIRRARGYAPVPVPIPIPDASRTPNQLMDQGSAKSAHAEAASPKSQFAQAPVVFAAGSEQKNTFAFAHDGQAYVSQHIGDMEDADVYDAWLESKRRFEKLFALRSHVLACDMHPEYLASKWARSQAFREGLPLTEVQHHHAHIASVLGEHGMYGPAIGIAFDGTGFGLDGAIWGGEVLLANQVDYERFANFSYMPMPGGAAAIKNPLRMAYGVLWAYDLLDHPAAKASLDALGEATDVCGRMIESGLNTPMTSSVGRLFDAVSALLGICTQPSYEGEAAVLLDAVRATAAADEEQVAREDAERYAVTMTKNAAVETSTAHDTSVVLLDAEQTLRAVLDDMADGVPERIIALRFHDAIVGAIVQVAELARAMYGISLVALSGGCFMNRYLVEQAAMRLGAAGFTVALNGNLPPNDGSVSYGQAVVASSSR